MRKRLWSITEVMETYQVNEDFLEELEQEELLCPVCRKDSPDKLFSSKDLETLRIAKILIEEMGVNLAGVEIILRMRETIYQMRYQFDDILEDLVAQIRERLRE
jgi:MerR family transcriptional regulator/heat shock protein HspR